MSHVNLRLINFSKREIIISAKSSERLYSVYYQVNIEETAYGVHDLDFETYFRITSKQNCIFCLLVILKYFSNISASVFLHNIIYLRYLKGSDEEALNFINELIAQCVYPTNGAIRRIYFSTDGIDL